jgi:glutamine synthetase
MGAPAGEGASLRLLMPDLTGTARGKYVRLEDLEKEQGLAAAVYLIGHDVDPQALPGLSGDVGFPDVAMRAEPGTLRRGWAPDEQIAMCSTYAEDRPFALDPRHALRRITELWREELGLVPRISMELEFYLLEPDGTGGWRAADIPGGRPYGTGPDVDPHGVVRLIREAAARAGLHVEGMSSEFFAGQYEINLAPREALEASDEAFLLRLLVREVLHDAGLKATFLPRPFNDRGGNGLHINMSFLDARGGHALDGPGTADGLDPIAHRMIAGLLAHHVGMTALLAPTVNSYKRLRPDLMCGFFADWGYDNRFVTVRVPRQRGGGARLEARQADGSGCPH